jgi:membrane-associated protease RseP (regulator of RpoE activity)
MHPSKVSGCLGAAALLVACVNSGPRVNPATAARFEPGRTTCAEIIATLGQPSATVWTSDGIQAINYTHVEAAARPETFIPIIGPLVGGADARSASYTFRCDRNGVLASEGWAGAQTSGGAFGSSTTAAAYVGPPTAQPRGVRLGVEVVAVARGLLVTVVAPGTPAAQAGVRAGDVLVKLGETTLTSPEGLSDRLTQVGSGSSLPLEIWRDGAPVVLSARFN